MSKLNICIIYVYIMHIMHILHTELTYVEQNRALLDTLRLHQSNNNHGHLHRYFTLLIGHTKHPGQMRVSSWPTVPTKLQQTNRQDMVFIRPPGISDGAFQDGQHLVLQAAAPV